MWTIVCAGDGNRTVLDEENPKFYSCKRFFADEKYKEFSKLPIDEVLSIDAALFPYDERALLDEKIAKTQDVANEMQIMRVWYVPSDAISVVEKIDGFDFCGYDLVDGLETSAFTNCGGFFDDAFTYEDLNSFGLIPNYQSARKIQVNLERKYPDEEHADCLLFAIWRRV